ncbi:MAG: hypothetical protein ACM3IJ_04425 [Candidatus Levyibacteriota bacterium]
MALVVLVCTGSILAPGASAGPQSSTYEIKSFNFGSGGAQSDNSSSYSLFGSTGETSTNGITSSNYTFDGGLSYSLTVNTPGAPTFTNPSSYYNKLHLLLNTASNPTDTKYAIAVSNDNFVSNTAYVQTDHTLSASPVWQTYASWGGASGIDVIGLTPATTYYSKVTAIQGSFTQSPYSTTANASTVDPSIAFDIDVSAADTETAPPYILDLGSLSIGSVTTATQKIWVDLDTNAAGGAYIYTSDNNAGLKSATNGHTIPSVSTDLSGATQGFGIRSNSATETSGGPLTPIAPYDGSNDVVGAVDTTIRELFSSSGNTIAGGRGSILVKARASATTPASTDYSDTLTIIASATF